MAESTRSLGPTIRLGAKYISWATAAWAPISTAYATLAGGHLKFAHIYTTLGIQQVLLNLAWTTGQLLFASLVFFFMACVVIGLPLGLVQGLFKMNNEHVEGVASRCAMVLGFCAGLFAVWNANPDPFGTVRNFGDFASFDQVLTVIGGIALAAIYVFLFISIRKTLKEEN